MLETILALIFVGSSARAQLCPGWAKAVQIGQLETGLLGEASGLAISRKFNRLYHVNDSGDGPYFYVTERNGSSPKKIKVKDSKPRDVEDLALGPCPNDDGTCLAIADIGDNRLKRETIEIVYVREEEKFADEVTPVARQKFKYPDKPHNAEALVLLPKGGVVIATKESGQVSQPSQFFRFKGPTVAGKVATLERFGEIDVPGLVNDKLFGGLVTSMDRSQDGSKFLLLTYEKVLEVVIDLESGTLPAKSELKLGPKVSIVDVRPLPQQEAIAYEPSGTDFIYTTENFGSALLKIKGKWTPIMRSACTGASK